MKIRTRRQLMRATALASFIALFKQARADYDHDGDHGTGRRDKHGGDPSPQSCFLKGTRILTPDGEREVQDLNVGDEVITLSGNKPVIWIGFQNWANSTPIRIAASAISDGSPSRDLYISPGHCIYCALPMPVLIPVKYLVNNISITEARGSSTGYYHLDFGSHEIIFAEAAAVESYGGYRRDTFANFLEYERRYGQSAELRPYAPILRYSSRSQELGGVVKSIVSGVIDVRDPIQIIHDQLVDRARYYSACAVG